MRVKIQKGDQAPLLFDSDLVAVAVQLTGHEREELMKIVGPGFKVVCAAPLGHPLLHDQTQMALFAYDGWPTDEPKKQIGGNIFVGLNRKR